MRHCNRGRQPPKRDERRELRRYLATDGDVGTMPTWYPLLRAARYMGVAPWELMDRPIAWMEWALIAEAAENEAREVMAKKGRRNDHSS